MAEIVFQTKNVDIWENGSTTVLPDASGMGIDAFNKVNINAEVEEEILTQSIKITENKVVTAPSGIAYSKVTVEVEPDADDIEKIADEIKEAIQAKIDEAIAAKGSIKEDGDADFSVSAPLPEPSEESFSLDIVIPVEAGKEMKDKIIAALNELFPNGVKENGEYDLAVDGSSIYSFVVDVQPDLEVVVLDSLPKEGLTVEPSEGKDGLSRVSIPALTTLDPDLKAENIIAGKEIFGVEGSVEVPVLETLKSAVLDFSSANYNDVVPEEGYDAIKTVRIVKPANLKPENVKKDVEIAGIIGTSEGGEMKEVIPSGTFITNPGFLTAKHNWDVSEVRYPGLPSTGTGGNQLFFQSTETYPEPIEFGDFNFAKLEDRPGYSTSNYWTRILWISASNIAKIGDITIPDRVKEPEIQVISNKNDLTVGSIDTPTGYVIIGVDTGYSLTVGNVKAKYGAIPYNNTKAIIQNTIVGDVDFTSASSSQTVKINASKVGTVKCAGQNSPVAIPVEAYTIDGDVDFSYITGSSIVAPKFITLTGTFINIPSTLTTIAIKKDTTSSMWDPILVPSKESILHLFDTLPEATKTLQLISDTYDQLVDEEKAVIVAKGWTLTRITS